MSSIDQHFYTCRLGMDYTLPIVDITKTYKYASLILPSMRKDNLTTKEAQRIIAMHTHEERME